MNMKGKTVKEKMEATMYRCILCGTQFKDIEEHLTTHNNKQHKDYLAQLSLLEKKPCFCGGKIVTFTHYDKDGELISWETMCQKCGILINED